MTPMTVETDLIHHPYRPPAGFESPQFATHKASTVIFPDTHALRSRTYTAKTGYTYGLRGTPTTYTLEERLAATGILDHQFEGFPVAFWDLFGEAGTPVRMTISEMGPLVLARLLQLNDTQTGVLYAAFKIADDQGLLLLDLDDLRSLLTFVGQHAAELKLTYGNLSATSIGAIQRNLLVLDSQGASQVFGEPALGLKDLMQVAPDGRGVINLLDATRLVTASPDLYACFLFWLLSELFEELPERGDAEKPLLVLFFDEAHLLFRDTPKPLVDKIEQVVRLIRSKGVGVFFVTQSPLDVPQGILGQLGLKIQHALRAFTPREQKAVQVVAESFRANPGLNTATAITELGTGEALISTLDAKGQPTPVERVLIRPPSAQIGPASAERRREIMEASRLQERYATAINRESAHEKLTQRATARVEVNAEPEAPAASDGTAPSRGTGRTRETPTEALVKSVLRAAGSQIGRQIVRGILGSLLGGGRR
jgi:DNA helicase HerA-like ATPase